MTKSSKQDATDSAVGFYYQALFALLLLLDADDGGVVSVETGDDIQVSVSNPRLFQLKHSRAPRPLTEKNDGFWKTLGTWMPKLSSSPLQFVFVTCAQVANGSLLVPRSRSRLPVRAAVRPRYAAGGRLPKLALGGGR